MVASSAEKRVTSPGSVRPVVVAAEGVEGVTTVSFIASFSFIVLALVFNPLDVKLFFAKLL